LRIQLITDAWSPQVNGVVVTLRNTIRWLERWGHEVRVISPEGFRTFPMPTYPEIPLAILPAREVARRIREFDPDAIHIATEGPLGSAARAYCLRHGLAFTTAFHTRFPDILAKALHIPSRWSYAWFRRFHAPSSGVMVPTEGMLRILQGHGFVNLRQWSHGVDLSLFKPVDGADLGLPRPVFLYVGRVSYEKNLDAFLKLDLPGTKLVYGVGPVLDRLQREYPGVEWRGVVPRAQLVNVYSAADVFVFPSHSETFGLVMLEAMACGLPVAAFPVPGPLDVVGSSDGGVLHDDLRHAALEALKIPRQQPRDRALQFDWKPVCEQFIDFLTPARAAQLATVTKSTRNLHKLGA
jgi:glycosyltransferase involved in cell wall biosynthesis